MPQCSFVRGWIERHPDYADLVVALGPVTVPDVADHVLGNPDAPVTLLEYGDYECPYCAAAAPVLRQVVTESDGQVRLVFRNFPLAVVHPFALTAALAAEAAGRAGRASGRCTSCSSRGRTGSTTRRCAPYADELGLDGSRVVGDAAQAFGDKVEADFAAGLEAGVGGHADASSSTAGCTRAGSRRAPCAGRSGRRAANGSDPDGRRDPRPGRQRRWSLGIRRAQREALPEDPEQDDPGDRCNY